MSRGAHPCVVVRKLISAARDPASNPTRGIKGEKPNPWPVPFMVHIGAHIGLGKSAKPGRGRKSARPNAEHAKRHQADPSSLFAVRVRISVDREPRRQQLLDG